jgi:hypothetical protein
MTRKANTMRFVAFLIAILLPATALAQTAVAVQPKTTIPATAVSPSYVQLATNVEVIPNIEDAVKSSGI